MKPTKLKVGDVVQINPKMKDSYLAGCLMIVTRSEPGGARGYFCDIVGRGKSPGLMFGYAQFAAMEFIGRAAWVVDTEEIDTWNLNKRRAIKKRSI